MEIRKLKKKDYKEVNEILLKLHNLHVEKNPCIFSKIDKFFTKKEWINRLESKKYKYFGAFEEDKLIGIIGIAFSNFSGIVCPEISCLYVEEEYRKQKIAKNLMEKAIKYTKKKLEKYDKTSNFLDLDVMAFNEDAINFYKSMGFNFKCHIMELKIKD